MNSLQGLNQIQSLLVGIPQETWIIAIVIVLAIGIISIIKKAVKLGIMVIVVALVLTYSGITAEKIRNAAYAVGDGIGQITETYTAE